MTRGDSGSDCLLGALSPGTARRRGAAGTVDGRDVRASRVLRDLLVSLEWSRGLLGTYGGVLGERRLLLGDRESAARAGSGCAAGDRGSGSAGFEVSCVSMKRVDLGHGGRSVACLGAPLGASAGGASRRVMTDGGRVDDRESEGSSELDPESESAGDGGGGVSRAVAYRHDVHKLRCRRHDAAVATFAGVAVNETVPLGADRDAALLSRPRGDPEPTVANHRSPYRLSLVSGATAVETERLPTVDAGFRDLVTAGDAERLHARWLTSTVAGAYSESMYYPYSSLQYHTLLTAALLDAYRAGYAFDELWLTATPVAADAAATRDAAAALAADVVEPHRTVVWTPAMALHVTGEPAGRPAARLGAEPARSFGDTWSRLSAHPIDVAGARRWRLLDAQLRRIRSWSAALAYIADFVAVYDTPDGRGGRA